jgi:hypothetical protein
MIEAQLSEVKPKVKYILGIYFNISIFPHFDMETFFM